MKEVGGESIRAESSVGDAAGGKLGDVKLLSIDTGLKGSSDGRAEQGGENDGGEGLHLGYFSVQL